MRILVIEDEHKIAHSLKKGLEQESHAVDVVFDGKAGLDFGQSDEYDLIILDRMLPEIDGVIICQKLREKKIHTPILMLTAKGQIDDRVEGLDAGADDYLVKPFAFSELLARLRALSRRPKKSVATVLTCSDLSLNTTTFVVTRGKKDIQLSHKEYALLEYLLRHKDQVISKDQIISHVWDYDATVLPNSVEVYIKHLRKKIDREGAVPLIHTIRGFGYKLGAKQ